MFNNLLNINPSHASLASISAAVTGEVGNLIASPTMVDTALQHSAWAVAIIAGIVSIVNGTRKWFHHSKNNQKDQENDTDYNSEP